MMWLLTLFVLVSLNFNMIRSDFKTDFQQLVSTASCNSTCWFNASEITTKTIDSWPSKCEVVCGFITFTKNSNVSMAKLKTAFEKLQTLKGAIRVDSSSLTNLSFFTNWTRMECKDLQVSISKNSKLTDISALYDMRYPDECPFEIIYNYKLNASIICELENYRTIFSIYVFDNKVDCAVYGYLLIQGTDSPKAIASLATVKNMTGSVIIRDTQLQNLSFFKSLERLRFQRNKEPFLDLQNNPNMTRLDFPALKTVIMRGTSWPAMNFENLNPNFCLTNQELGFYISLGTLLRNVDLTYCPIDYNRNTTKICLADKLSNLDDDCVHIMGNMMISTEDEDYVEKLENVTKIFGSLTLKNTSFENFDFLDKLQQVILLNDTNPAIHVLSNKNLQELKFPSLKHPFNVGVRNLIVEDTPNAFNSSTDCLELQGRLSVWVKYEGVGCDDIDEKLEEQRNKTALAVPGEYSGVCQPTSPLMIFCFMAILSCILYF